MLCSSLVFGHYQPFYRLTEMRHGAHRRLGVIREHDSLLVWRNSLDELHGRFPRACVVGWQREEIDRAICYKDK